MCGRYSITTNPEALRWLFAFLNATPNIRPRYNAAPTDELPVVRLDREGRRELVMLRWGLIPSWAEDRIQHDQRSSRDLGNQACFPRGVPQAAVPGRRRRLL
jgi:putative SOS response-associated peptidase YedK